MLCNRFSIKHKESSTLLNYFFVYTINISIISSSYMWCNISQ